MSPERWQQVERIFQQALERPAEQRDAFLEAACDQDLQNEVKRLLAGDQEAGGFLEEPAAELAARRIAEESQQLAAGTRIGPYQVQELLGSGGMGYVYKARDTRLGRTVAIKALQVQTIRGQGRERLLREAQAASALNHPNIVTIYDVVTEGSRDSIVMEYLDGEPLDALIARRELGLREVIDYGIEIADALAAAHAAGIVHRDIKPGNIMALRNGSGGRNVKVLDFGLALQAPAEGSPRLTQEGLIMGTTAYMSPEQAEGRKVDWRSDVFSFGAVLYEMATGRAAFKGETAVSTIAAVLRDEPAPARTVAPEIPRELEWIIALCLKKSPQRRWQSMADLKVALEEVRDRLNLGKVEEVPMESAGQRHRLGWGAKAAALAGLALAVAVSGYLGRRTAPLHDPQFERLTYRRGDVTSARFTPDGQTIIYSAEWDTEPSTIYSTRAGSRESRPLGLPAGKILSLSPAGEMAILSGTLANTFNSGTLSRAPLAGGAPREVLDNVMDGDWADASNLAVIRGEGSKSRVEFPVGKVVFEVEGRRPPFCLRVSPKGDGVAFFHFDGEVGDYALIYVPRGGEPKTLTRGWRGVGRSAWSPGGDEIWFVASVPGGDPALRAVNLSGRERIVAHTQGWMVLDDVSRDGRVLATQVNSRIAMFFGRTGEQEGERDLSWLDTSAVFDISADGKSLLFAELSYGEGRNPAIYLRKSDGSPAVRLGNCSRPSLSPDGKWVVCVHAEGRSSTLMLLPVGAGESRRLPNEGFRYEQVEWMPDGQSVLFTGGQGGAAPGSYLQVVDGGGSPKGVTPAGTTVRRVSPDGTRAVSIHSGGIFVQPLDGSAGRRIAAAQPGELAVRWEAAGRAIFTAVPVGGVSFQVYRVDTASGKKSLWKELKPPDPVGVTMYSLVVAADGVAYAYSYQRDLADLYLISGLR